MSLAFCREKGVRFWGEVHVFVDIRDRALKIEARKLHCDWLGVSFRKIRGEFPFASGINTINFRPLADSIDMDDSDSEAFSQTLAE